MSSFGHKPLYLAYMSRLVEHAIISHSQRVDHLINLFALMVKDVYGQNIMDVIERTASFCFVGQELLLEGVEIFRFLKEKELGLDTKVKEFIINVLKRQSIGTNSIAVIVVITVMIVVSYDQYYDE